MKRLGEMVGDSLHIFVLFSFALAQPVFDLLARHAEFFIVRNSEPVDVLLLILMLCLFLPLCVVLVEAVMGLLGPRMRTVGHGGIVAILTASIALQALKRTAILPGSFLVGIAALGGVIGAFSYLRFPPVRMFLTILSPACLLFPGLFLFHSQVFKIAFPQHASASGTKMVKTTTPIVMVIFDELPVTSLMDKQQQIDSVRYPNFAMLAQGAIWFRHTSAVSDTTAQAVPSILTGNYPNSSLLPTADDQPHNIFTLLESSHDFQVFGTMTHLCPDRLCKRDSEHLWKRMKALMLDLSLVYLHILLPQELSASLPSVTQNWTYFAHRTGKVPHDMEYRASLGKQLWHSIVGDIGKDRARLFSDFVNAIDSVTQPTFYFLHILLPHVPYHYLPSGLVYSTDKDIVGFVPENQDKWSNDEWAVIQGYQRHLLQVGFADTLLGNLLNRLKAVGLYDRSLIVITADHGVSFLPNDSRRQLTETNFSDIMFVPLFIKPPHQQKGTINDHPMEVVDILPTLADILKIRLPWAIEGRSAFNAVSPGRNKKFFSFRNIEERLTFDPGMLEARSTTLKRKLTLFGSGRDKSDGLFGVGPHKEFIGHRVDKMNISKEADVAIELDFPNLFLKVDPGTGFVPAHITGRVHTKPLHSKRKEEEPLHLAIAINGTISAVTQTWTFPEKGEMGRWSAMVDESVFRPGQNDVEVFLISLLEGKPVLERTQNFSWYRSAAVFLDVLHEIVSEQGG